jgi:hypothetical protein
MDFVECSSHLRNQDPDITWTASYWYFNITLEFIIGGGHEIEDLEVKVTSILSS